MHPILILTQLVKRRIAMGKDAFYKRGELLRGGLNRKLKKRMVKALVWSVVLYGSETWTMRQEDIKRLEAFEMWIWRRMEKISWVERRTNEEILQLVEEKKITDRHYTWAAEEMDRTHLKERHPTKRHH